MKSVLFLLILETQCGNTVAFVACLVLFEEKLRDRDDWNYIKLLEFSDFVLNTGTIGR